MGPQTFEDKVLNLFLEKIPVLMSFEQCASFSGKFSSKIKYDKLEVYCKNHGKFHFETVWLNILRTGSVMHIVSHHLKGGVGHIGYICILVVAALKDGFVYYFYRVK